MIEDSAPLRIEDRHVMNCFEISQSSDMMPSMIENSSVAYCYCIGCSAWVPYNDFGSVAAGAKSILVAYEKYCYHSESQMKSTHKLGPQGSSCNNRWIVGDVGVLGRVTGPVELKSHENQFYFLPAQSHCAGPNLIVSPMKAEIRKKVFWIDAECSHNPVSLIVMHGEPRIFVAIKVFEQVRADNSDLILKDRFSVYVDYRSVDGICSSMKARWESLNDLGFETLQLTEVNFRMIDDSYWLKHELVFEVSYLREKLHMRDDIVQKLPTIYELKNIRAHNVPVVTEASFSPTMSPDCRYQSNDTESMSSNLNVVNYPLGMQPVNVQNTANSGMPLVLPPGVQLHNEAQQAFAFGAKQAEFLRHAGTPMKREPVDQEKAYKDLELKSVATNKAIRSLRDVTDKCVDFQLEHPGENVSSELLAKREAESKRALIVIDEESKAQDCLRSQQMKDARGSPGLTAHLPFVAEEWVGPSDVKLNGRKWLYIPTWKFEKCPIGLINEGVKFQMKVNEGLYELIVEKGPENNRSVLEEVVKRHVRAAEST